MTVAANQIAIIFYTGIVRGKRDPPICTNIDSFPVNRGVTSLFSMPIVFCLLSEWEAGCNK